MSLRRLALTLCLASLVVLAGCNAAPTSDGPPPEATTGDSTTTATPTATPETTSSPSTATATTTPTGYSVEVSIRNNASRPVRVSVTSVTGPLDGVRVSDADGETQTYDVERVEDLPDAALDNATHFTVLGENVGDFSHEFGGPGETKLTVEQTGVPADARFVLAAFPANGTAPTYEPRVVACEEDEQLTQLDVVVTDDSIGYGFGCFT